MTLEEQIQKLTAERDALRWDVEAYRGALGYPIPGSHTGKLTDGTVPQCGMCNSEYRKNLESERDAAQADLKAIGECVGGDPLAVRGLVESMDAAIKERDAALKEMGEAVLKLDIAERTRDAALKACASFRDAFDALHDYVRRNRNDPEGIAQIINGVQASDCGKGYHHDDEWKLVVEALKASRCGNPECKRGWIETITQDHSYDGGSVITKEKCGVCEMKKEALAHAAKLVDGK